MTGLLIAILAVLIGILAVQSISLIIQLAHYGAANGLLNLARGGRS